MIPLPLLGGGRRIAPRPQAPITPFDPNDEYGEVHTVLPPEQDLSRLIMLADFNGVTLDLDRWNPQAPQPLPFLRGANSTPLAMLMTPMLIMYPRYWQDADLTTHAERAYTDFVISVDPWNAAEN